MYCSNPAYLLNSLLFITASFVTVFLTCEMGQNVSNQFNKFGDKVGTCDWYLLLRKLQQMFVIVMINAQEPVSIRGFGNVECTRDSFKRVSFFYWGSAFICT